jgi:hypothetical protein
MYYDCGNPRRGFLWGGVVLLAVVCLILSGCSKKDDEQKQGGAVAAEIARSAGDGDMEFAMEEFSVFDKELSQGQMGYQLTSGQSADAGVSNKPMEGVKVYPKVASENAVYGKITFGTYIFDTSDNFVRYFVFDESEGTGTGHDRLYFDLDGDLDLSNDVAVGKMDAPPGGSKGASHGYFEAVEFSAQTAKGKDVEMKVVPFLTTFYETNHQVRFIVPTGRRGKITIAGEEIDAKMVQSAIIGGRYDSPTTTLMLGDDGSAIPFLCALRKYGDVLYEFSSNTAGDKLVVKAYDGDWGVLKVAGEDGKISLGYLVSADALVDLGDCAEKDGGRLVPVGDWRPVQLAVETKDVRYGISADIAPPGQEVIGPAIYGIKISKDKAFALGVGGEAEVQFKTPTKGQKIAPGETMQASAMMYDAAMGVMLSSLEDKSRPKGDEVTMPDGTKMQQYASIDPDVKILDSAGKTVAEGKMPFG